MFLYWVFATVLLALAVKQVSYSIESGSIFGSLRIVIRRGSANDSRAFRILEQLITCKLCLTMQVSIWMVGVPLLLLGSVPGWASNFLGVFPDTLAEWTIYTLACFIYAIAISGLALAVWNYLEYPVKRFEDTLFRAEEAERKLELLKRQMGSDAADLFAAEASTTLSYDDFRSFINFVNRECRGIGCGYRRRSCRAEAVTKWLEDWMEEHPDLISVVGALREELDELLRRYFRHFSEYDEEIEDEGAFKKLYEDFAERSTAALH